VCGRRGIREEAAKGRGSEGRGREGGWEGGRLRGKRRERGKEGEREFSCIQRRTGVVCSI